MRLYQLRHLVVVLVAMVLAGGGLVLASNPAVAEGISLPTPTGQVPKAGTPFVDDGKVMAFQQVGSTMVAGGTFTSVAGSPRRALLAMTGPSYGLSTTFEPVLDGDVAALLAGPTAGTVFVAGSFATVNGQKSKSLALLDTTTGAQVTTFKVPFINGIVNIVEGWAATGHRRHVHQGGRTGARRAGLPQHRHGRSDHPGHQLGSVDPTETGSAPRRPSASPTWSSRRTTARSSPSATSRRSTASTATRSTPCST